MPFTFQRLLAGLLLLLCGTAASAQAPEQDCINAIPVCQTTYVQTNSYSNTGAFAAELSSANQGCLSSGEKNDVWYVINVTSPGLLEFTITPNNSSDDYDFGLWDISGVGCSALFNYTTNTPNAYPPVRCNYSGISGQTGISSTIVGSQWDVALPVSPGETYVLNISNFSSSQTGYTLTFAPSTASIFDTVRPYFTNVYSKCQAPTDTLLLYMSEPVKCASITGTGSDFTITGTSPATIASANGLTCFTASTNATSQIIRVLLSSTLVPGNYVLHANIGSDNNTLLDNCGNAQLTSDSVLFSISAPVGPAMVQTFPPSCTGVKVRFDKKFRCNSVALNGSDFQITGPEPVTITSAKVLSCNSTFNIADTVILAFSKSIFTPGTYTISTKVGTDGNGILDTCNQPTTNSLTFDVSDAGLITASIDPDVLCEPGYVNLNSAPPYALPPANINCGAAATVPNTPTAAVTIGTGNGSMINSSPFYQYYDDARTQIIYRATDLQAAGLTKGTLSALSMNITQKGSTAPFQNFTIKMGCAATQDLVGGFDPTPLVTVFNPKNYTTAVGNNLFTFDVPYNWDGTSNILLDICFDQPNYTYTFYDQVQFTSVSGYTAVAHNHTDGSAGCTLSSQSFYNSSERPNVTFTHQAPPPSTFDQKWTPSLYVEDSTAFSTRAYVPVTTTFQIQIIDSNGCYRRAKDEVIVSVRNPELYSVDTFICIGKYAPLYAGPATSYNWYPQDGSLSCYDCANPIATPTQTTTYFAVLFDQYGCSDTLSVTVNVDPLPVVDAGRDTSVQFGEGVPLYVAAPGGRFYQWDPPFELDNANIPNPVASPDNSTSYAVMVIDTNGCVNGDTVRVSVIRDAGVGIPSAFSPNADGVNDEFRVALLRYQRVSEFRVFDRWGKQVWAAAPGNMNRGWDGRYPDGRAADAGTYSYIVRVVWPDGGNKMYKGTVLLLR